ncbi:MAG: OmcA/MtrC family decaheme c-type cytochrome [Bryobacteraceae bacterium]|nr:OmcA/MtrC family decaheme c-type cytochrome [Bryobacteraceae bacterium]
MIARLLSTKLLRVSVAFLLVVGSFALISATKPTYSTLDKAFYADPNTINFVRPGLDIQILGAEIATDGTMTARVKFTDPRGLALDRTGVNTPGAVSASLVMGTIPRGQKQYITYTVRTQTSPITGVAAVQSAADTGGRWQETAPGEYLYTFGTKAPADIDRSATHTVGVYGNRNLTEFDLGVYLKEVTHDFVPDGSPVTVVRDVINTASCNKCHDRLQLHGETGRTTMEGCSLCHNPMTVDPDTGNTVDMKVMIHKIHRGRFLPSVVAGGEYVIIGNRQSVHDFSGVTFSPLDPEGDTTRQCQVCHRSDVGATQHDAWLTNPSREACGSCHDNVNFATGENHANLPQPTDNLCSTCHIPEGELEFDISIKGAHTTSRFSRQLPGVVFDITNIQDGAAGKAPTVTFTLKDKTGAPLAPSTFSSLSLVLAGPTTDYTTYIRQDVRAAATGSGDRWTYTFTRPIPEGASGSWSMSIEGRRSLPITDRGAQRNVNDAGNNVVKYFSLDSSPVTPRRQVVDLAKCNDCHVSLTIHGSLRNQTEYCVVCHNPRETDAVVRPAEQMPPEGIDFRAMIHRIHSGAELGRDYTIYGFGSRPINFNNVHFTSMVGRNNCNLCHVNNSQQLPLSQTHVDVTDPRGFLNPVGPTTIACLGCHDNIQAASHALVNTSALGESCSACHGPGKQFSLDRVHAE